jgi:hypothetical protein
MDKIFKEMSLCNKYYDSDFYAIAIDKYNKKNERRVEFYKKAKSEKSKIWVKDVLNCTRFKDYAGAITHLEKTYDCEIEYISSDRGDYDYMICHVVLERGLPVGFSYLNFKAKSSVKYTYPPTVTYLSNNDPIPPEYIHDSNDDIADIHIPSGPPLQLHIPEDEKNDLKTLINRCYEEKAKGKKPAVIIDSLPMPDLVKDNSSNNKEIPHEYYVIVFHNDEGKDYYFQGFNEYGSELYDSFEYAKKFDDFEAAVSMMTIIEDPVPVTPCEDNDPCKLFSITKIREYSNGDWFVIDSKSYKDLDTDEE